MRKFKYLIFAVITVITACNKSKFDDLSGEETISGTAIIADTLNGNLKYTILKNTAVYLANLNGSGTYLYSVNTNDQGKYSFSGIQKEKAYKIYASTDTGTVKFYGVKEFQANSYPISQTDSLKLFPAANNQNGIHFILRAADGSKLQNTTAWVFTSPTAFNSGTSEGKLFDLTTNIYGVANKFNIPAGTYYIRVKTQSGNQTLQGQETVLLTATGIKTATIKLAPYSANNNGMGIKVLDTFNTPVNTATIYCYRSQAVFQLDVNNTNSLFNITSNSSGDASLFNIDPATYYLRVMKIVGKDTLRAEESIVVNTTGTTNKTIVIKK